MSVTPGVCVTIPTKDRPDKLARCLSALAAARTSIPFTVHVCDSSTDDRTHDEVRAVCAAHPFVEVVRHHGWNLGIARNVCARAASEELAVNVDDDIRVEPDAVDRLVAAYRSQPGDTVVGGSVWWFGPRTAVRDGQTAIKMRRIGYGRPARPGEAPDFLVGALFLYPRSVGLRFPWNERIRNSDDRFIGALWRHHGVTLAWEPRARAVHDDEHVDRSGPEEQRDQVYVNLFDALMANPRPVRAAQYEILGFAAGLKAFSRSPALLRRFLSAWAGGHRQLVADRRYLRGLLDVAQPIS